MKKYLVLFVCLLLTVGCNKETSQVDPTKEVEPEPAPIVEKKLKIVDLESKSRPFAIMINNHPTAQPLQSGINDAYIVYEIIVEGGISRMMAVFKDTDTSIIGSIRSSRHYFLDYALENDAIYSHHGQSPQALSDFSTLKNLSRIVVDDKIVGWRDKTLNVAYEHTLFTSMERIKANIGSRRSTTDSGLLLKYSIDPLDLKSMEKSIRADKVDIRYSDTQLNTFKYNWLTKLYTKYSNNVERKDYETGEPFTVKNIITYKLAVHNIDSYGRKDITNIGNGSGYFISEGYAVPITWEKKTREGKTVYRYLDGTELVVNDGNTYIQIQPSTKKLTIDDVSY